MTYLIRDFRESDASALAAITLAAIRHVGSRRYSPEQVEVWAARHPGPERFLARSADGEMIFVAAGGDDRPVAYALLVPDGHLDMLYCDPDHTRQGLSDRLLTVGESKAVELGLSRLFTEASELARPAFERAGYKVTHRRDFEIEGVAIHNYAMEKRLA